MFCRDAWLDLSRDTLMLGLEAQSVIGLRLLKAAAGGAPARQEAALMVTEKAQAVIEAQSLLAHSLLAGQPHLGPARLVALFRGRVQANQDRLGQGC